MRRSVSPCPRSDHTLSSPSGNRVPRPATGKESGASSGVPQAPHIPDRVLFERSCSLQVLVFGCAYHHRIADESCSDATLRCRRDEWIDLGVMEAPREMALAAYERTIGLELSDLAVDGCITKAPCGGEKAGKSPVG